MTDARAIIADAIEAQRAGITPLVRENLTDRIIAALDDAGLEIRRKPRVFSESMTLSANAAIAADDRLTMAFPHPGPWPAGKTQRDDDEKGIITADTPAKPPSLADYIRAAIADWHIETNGEMTVEQVAAVFEAVLADLIPDETGQ